MPTPMLPPKRKVDEVPGRRGWITDNVGSMKVFVQRKRVGHTLRQVEALGLKPQGRGEHELMLWFDPASPARAEFANQAVKAYRRRRVVVTPGMLDRLVAALAVRGMPFPERKFYQEGGVGDPALVTLGKGHASVAMVA